MKKNTTEQVLKLLEEKNLIWLDNIYIDALTPLNCICKVCNNKCDPAYCNLSRRGGCVNCGIGKRSHTMQEVEKILEKNNLFWIDSLYINASTKLNCVCKICKSWCKPTYHDLQQNQGGCKKCGYEIKRKQTCLEKYGASHNMQVLEIALKCARSAHQITTLKHWFSREDINCRGGYEIAVVNYLNKNKIDL